MNRIKFKLAASAVLALGAVTFCMGVLAQSLKPDGNPASAETNKADVPNEMDSIDEKVESIKAKLKDLVSLVLAGTPFEQGRGIPCRCNDRVSLPEYVVEPPDIIQVEVLEALPDRPITGERLVWPDGKISLGFYGEVYVAGLTIREIKEKVALHLQEFIDNETLGLTTTDPKTGKVEPIEPADTNRIFVDVTAPNSKDYYSEGEVSSPGRFPVTDEVLKALERLPKP